MKEEHESSLETLFFPLHVLSTYPTIAKTTAFTVVFNALTRLREGSWHWMKSAGKWKQLQDRIERGLILDRRKPPCINVEYMGEAVNVAL